MDEVLLHGWDVARATGQPYLPSDAECEAVLPIVTPDDQAPDGSGREIFGNVVTVPDDAPFFDRILGLAGRDRLVRGLRESGMRIIGLLGGIAGSDCDYYRLPTSSSVSASVACTPHAS